MKNPKTCRTAAKKKSPAPDRSAASPENPPAQVALVVLDDSEAILRQAALDVIRAVPRIVPALIDEAAEGSYLHAKFLFDFAGISTPERDPDDEPQSLAAILLERLALDGEHDAFAHATAAR
jgi:hypothetical protein